MSDTTTRALERAWKLTNDTDELHINKLYQLLTNLERITGKTILDLESSDVVKQFMIQNKDRDLIITLNQFKPFFDDLLGKPLQKIIGTPPKLNLNSNATSNFINRELLNLKNRNQLNDDEIKYRDNLINQLEEKNSNLFTNYNHSKYNGRKLSRDLENSNQYIDLLHDSYNKPKDNDLILKLNQQLELQNQLVKEMKILKNDLKQNKSFDLKLKKPISTTTTPPPPPPSKKKQKSWNKLFIYIFLILFLMSLINFILEYLQDIEI